MVSARVALRLVYCTAPAGTDTGPHTKITLLTKITDLVCGGQLSAMLIWCTPRLNKCTCRRSRHLKLSSAVYDFFPANLISAGLAGELTSRKRLADDECDLEKHAVFLWSDVRLGHSQNGSSRLRSVM